MAVAAHRKTPRAYGTWPSPVSAHMVAASARGFPLVQAAGNYVYWSETRPLEGGRITLMRAQPGAGTGPEELLPAPYSARSRVHEYGGGEFLALPDGTICFVNDPEQDIYVLSPNGDPERLTRESRMRFSDMALDATRRRLVAVAERFAARKGEGRPEGLIVTIDLDGSRRGRVRDLAAGRDFYAWPRPSPSGKEIAFIAWDLPGMPWDEAELLVARFTKAGRLTRPRRIAGGEGAAAGEPEWSGDGRLTFVSDETGWSNLRAWDGTRTLDICPREAEFGRPLWTLGPRTFTATGRELAARYLEKGRAFLLTRDGNDGFASTDCERLGLAGIGNIARLESGLIAVATRAAAPPAIVHIARGTEPRVIATAATLEIDAADVAAGRPITFRNAAGEDVHAIHYPPTSSRFRGQRNERPPAIVLAHGGPTSQAATGLTLRVQYYTSRGFAVLDVDYGGSTGYGRAYRERLDGNWGIVDVADCAAAARHLVQEGLADAARVAIAGGSAGGYTVLMALATTDVFAAGSSHYGISDLSLLMQHTHKFESGYLHRLLGTTPRRWRQVCNARSPITLADRIARPLILFQGLDDKVVPPEQSRLIADTVGRRGIEVELHEFPGEGHGFRRADVIAAVLEAELAFLTRAMQIGA